MTSEDVARRVLAGVRPAGGAVTLGWVQENTNFSARACRYIITDASFKDKFLFKLP
jgi:hypothetical protein